MCEGLDGVDERGVVVDAVESEEWDFGEDTRAERDGLGGEGGESAAFFWVAAAILVEDLLLCQPGQLGCLRVVER